jgi:DNA-directed RNA polymerase sigma subunit (sigma70/sigma32)
MKDYLLQIKIKNAPMMNIMRLNGIESASELCRASGVSQGPIGDFLNLKEVPLMQTGEWKPSVLKLAEFLKVLPDMLFPEQHITKALKTNKLEGEVSVEDIGCLIDSSGVVTDQLGEAIASEAENDTLDKLESCLGTLATRERKVLEKRFGVNQKPEDAEEVLSKEFKEVNLSHYPYSISEKRIKNKSDTGKYVKTYKEVGDDFSVTGDRIRAIESKAFRKLRHRMLVVK